MKNNLNTIIGALVAALILFVSSIVSLFTAQPELTFGDVTVATWVSIGGGALVAFLKDFQAISTRRVVNKFTGTGDGI
jgi:hypothetical protein